MRRRSRRLVASFTGAWIETIRSRSSRMVRTGRLLHGGVDRNSFTPTLDGKQYGRLLHGGVDRNSPSRLRYASNLVASFTGAWIETRNTSPWRLTGSSPPSRGRGSKLVHKSHTPTVKTSPPSRGRGSKPGLGWPSTPDSPSPPSRGRGSKLRHRRSVRKLRGSPPSRGRGSKHRQVELCWRAGRRLLHGGVDRNMLCRPVLWPGPCRLLHGGVDRNYSCTSGCAPSQGRLLHGGVDRNTSNEPPSRPPGRSPPSRGRGSKPESRARVPPHIPVASFPGAWIETEAGRARVQRGRVASFTGAWIETTPYPSLPFSTPSRLLHGGVDRNNHRMRLTTGFRRRLLHGGVDRNTPDVNLKVVGDSSPPSRGRGSKLHRRRGPMAIWRSPPSRGRGSKQPQLMVAANDDVVASFTGAWIETGAAWQTINHALVASFTGAWIETTSTRSSSRIRRKSPPSRGRGSKRGSRRGDDGHDPVVASLTRGRGSKPAIRRCHAAPEHAGRLPHGGVDRNARMALRRDHAFMSFRSPPSRGRGSKR